MPNFADLTIEQLVRPEGYDCECGKHHVCELKYLKIGRGVITEIGDTTYKGNDAVAYDLTITAMTPDGGGNKIDEYIGG